jgi:hypothetical protein
MHPLKLLKPLAVAIALVAASPALAQDDDDECGGIIQSLNKYGEQIMSAGANTPPAICAGMGKMVATMNAIREIADQCMEEGEKREKLIKEMDEATKVMEGRMGEICK